MEWVERTSGDRLADGLAISRAALLWLAGHFAQREALQPEEGQYLFHVGVSCLVGELFFHRRGNISGMQGSSAWSAGRCSRGRRTEHQVEFLHFLFFFKERVCTQAVVQLLNSL